MHEPPTDWNAWLSAANADLEQRNLLRILRPTCVTVSAVEVCDLRTHQVAHPPYSFVHVLSPHGIHP